MSDVGMELYQAIFRVKLLELVGAVILLVVALLIAWCVSNKRR